MTRRTWVRIEWDEGDDDARIIRRMCVALAFPESRHAVISADSEALLDAAAGREGE